jgi:preprotein translocase subunit SecA
MLTKIKKALGDSQERIIKKHLKTVKQINLLEKEYEALSDNELKNKTLEFKARLADGETVDDIIVEGFATVREASKRVLGMRHFDVQLLGGLVLNEGNIAEMATGEGKTLVASLPSYVRALEGKGVHVITVNEYLAKRDREIIGQIHDFLGLTVGINLADMSPSEKQFAYEADITYGIANEFGFDYLRDHMIQSKGERVQRPFHFALIDEIDSILIDEAKTPLIIAGKASVSSDLHYICAQVVKKFENETHYNFDPETKAVNLTEEGILRVEKAFGIDNLYELEHQTLYHYLIQALRASITLKRDVDYIVRKGKIELVDLFTGRILDGRSYSDGLHQAIEAKEGLEITEENKTQATITLQNFFRMYNVLSGMTGTAKTEEKEIQTVYGMDVISIPTNRPKIRADHPDKVYMTINQKYTAVTEEVSKHHEIGQPILIGTASIEQSEALSKYLEDKGIPYQLLNAKSEEKEAQLISLAGQKGQVTIATNMAGRGTDILLGEGVRELGGLYVIGTERHESRRIDNQLKGRSGRQGDPGKSQFFISLEDEMVERYAADDIEKIRKSYEADETGLITNNKIDHFMDKVQKISEGASFSMREYTLNLDNVVNQQRNVIYELRDIVIDEDNTLNITIPMIESTYKNIVERYGLKGDLLPEEWDMDTLNSEFNKLIPMETIDLKTLELLDFDDLDKFVLGKIAAYTSFISKFVDNAEVQAVVKFTLLRIIDSHWMNHLESMVRLKEGIGLRSYGQEDPMQAYEKEGYKVFAETYRSLEATMSYQMANIMQPFIIQEGAE